MKKKGQAAMEYLMTYGWAILIVIIVVAALWAMGVFTVGPSVLCSPCFSYFAFVDYADGTAMLTSGPQAIGELSVTAIPDTGTAINISAGSATSGQSLTLTDIDTTGDIAITITYNVTASGLEHTDTATIHNA